ncbi:MAG: hypothetical protein V7L25_27990 [Nostoc sp.]
MSDAYGGLRLRWTCEQFPGAKFFPLAEPVSQGSIHVVGDVMNQGDGVADFL